MNVDKIKFKLQFIVSLFVNEDYQNLFTLDRTKEISPEILRETIISYGGDMTLPPEETYDTIDIYEIENDDLTIDYAIDFYFWFNHQKSDLTLKVTIFDNGDFEIVDIRIL